MLIRPSSLRSPARQRGAAAVLLLLLIGAIVALAAYNSDSTRMTADAAQLKRATDAAALAAAQAYASDEDADITAIAERYVNANLGMDSAQTGSQLEIRTEAIESDGDPGVRVTATFRASSLLKGAGPQDVTVASAAVSRNKSLEVALALPNSTYNTFNQADLESLRSQVKSFAEELLGSGNNGNTWLAVLPYILNVNVYPTTASGISQTTRIRAWTELNALTANGLIDFSGSGAANFASANVPDRRARRLCLYRGMDAGEDFFWTQAPASTFRVSFNIRPYEGSADASYGTIAVDSSEFYATDYWFYSRSQADTQGQSGTSQLGAMPGCPSAPMVPLTNDLDEIDAGLDAMSRPSLSASAAPDVAIGWSAMALSPAFRGTGGWNLDDDLPKDFDETGARRIKAIVLLASPPDYLSWTLNGFDMTTFMRSLCSSLSEKNIKLYMIATGEAREFTSDFASDFVPGIQSCLSSSSDALYLTKSNFADAESEVQERLEKIVKELRQEASYTVLIE